MPLAAGDRFDRYLVEALLGRGGMGEVWRAVDPKLDRRIALKILSKGDALEPASAEAQSPIIREARAAAALDHPNVVAVFDVGEVGGTAYIAMELVEGVTLRAYVGDARVSTKRRVTWMLDVARALAAAHERGIVHRDIKPENVMVRGDGVLKVLDFGIARRMRVEPLGLPHPGSVITRDSAPIGTLRYMSPEQLEGARLDGRSDQFAWGVMALELLRGQHPWAAPATAVGLVDAILHARNPLLEEGAELPAAFVRAVERATSKRPAERFASMHELLATLEGDDRLPAARVPPPQLGFASTSGAVIFGDSSRRPFEPGQTVAESYEIVRLLGRGAMGEVYEALDGRYGRRVALKTVRADRSTDRRVLDRFRREVELAQRVVHPNVVRVLDVCTHIEEEGVEPILVLAMELLEGESLADLLRRRGSLSIAEARPIVEQMAGGLAAAHAAGVVHRDFKTANVFLETGPRGTTRAVVTDFGLSRSLVSRDQAATLPADAVLVGTPAYMAPEQIAGESIDARVDVYAFGIVLFEMVTGRLPFVGDTPAETAMIRLSKPPPAPRSFVPELHPTWDTAIVRCLARDPARRFATTTEALAALEGSAREKRSTARRTALVAAGAVLLAGGILIARDRSRPPQPAPAVLAVGSATAPVAASSSAPVAPVARPAVAVWALFNASGDARTAWLGSALGEMLRTELSAGEAVRVVPGATVARAQRDLGVAEGGDLVRTDVARAAAMLGATVLVDGAYVAVGEEGRRRVRVDLHAKSAAGDTLASVAEAGSESELFELVERAAGQLRAAVHVPAPEAATVQMARAALPASEAASREFAQGTAAMQILDYATARGHFERAVALDAAAPLPHASLAAALLAMGYVAQGAEEAKAALDRATGISREQRLAIEAQYLQSTYDRQGCADRWQVLAGFFPDNVEYGLSLARAYLAAGEAGRAKDTIVLLRKLPGVENDPRLDLLAAESVAGSDFKAMAAFARAALAKAKAAGSPSLALEAENALAGARGNLGEDLPTLADEYRRIERAYLEQGNQRAALLAAMTVSRACLRVGDVVGGVREARRAVEAAKARGYPEMEAKAELRLAQALRHQDKDAALEHLGRALSIARAIGDRGTEQGALNQRGILYSEAEKFAQARGPLEEAAKIAGAIGAKSEETDALDNLALVLANLGEPREALAVHERMAARYAETGNTSEQFLTLLNEAVILIDLGDPGGATTRLDEAERIGGGKQSADYELDQQGTRGRVLAMQGDVDAAHAAIQGVIDALRKNGAGEDVVGWESSLRDIDVANGVSRTADIQAVMKGSAATDGQEAANLAVSLAIDGRLVEALAAARRATQLAKGEQAFVKRNASLLGAADVLARAGHGDEALAISRPIAVDAEPRGLVPIVLQARLVAAHATAPGDDRNAQLAAIAHAARDRGMIGLARRVERELAPSER